MELRHLRYFVAVADAGNFTRAAENLGISQPPLSQQIQRLEHEIGSPLLRRLTRSVELTDAGRVLYEDAIKILKMSDAAFEKACSVGRGLSGWLRIGFASSTALNPRVFTLLHTFRDHYPMINLHPGELHMSALVDELLKGAIDLAFIRLPCARSRELEYRIIDNEEMVVALPANHPLAANHQLSSLAELRNETLIIFPREISPGLYDSVINACSDAGFTPSNVAQSPQTTSAISMVATGFGYTIIPASLSKIDQANVRYLPVKGTPLTAQVALAWRRHNLSKAGEHFLALL
ncbi:MULTISPECIES: LysR family transcriptional regulator [unclassified Tatumella]|uniref:LysR family transcriptional regulator n=1 Tax=unclassified Tatumella TaxID=2649542 RepID=UPI001BB080D1|nr:MULTISPECIES: LysR family transcriptional regulator [unclassified Tatumella]MBS0878084.1 LysR family transcriptional regulator [Tatumella sp. JGM82]MBS0890443.1 LysR family transcriptional regulator [Tatumella sp. JGM94]MBS0900899.1 LysR family transcriptional regulator [Tatumella sp. JGM100]